MRSKYLVLAFGAAAVCAFAGLDGSYVLPQSDDAIQYDTRPVTDRVAKLEKALESGEAKLGYDADFGYLPSVLKQLGIHSSSQVLVFSKTSFQAARIAPKLPRALYFTDDVTVGYVRGGDVLEFAAADPHQGVIFYTLDQEKTARPQIRRQEVCLQCHATGSTLGVPGLIVRSVHPDATGMPNFRAGSFVTDHRSPLDQRWGGWYVTGTHGTQHHLGNRIFSNPTDVKAGEDRGNLTTLNALIDAGAWPEPSSDIVALMVLEHQTRMQNLITRAGWEVRMALARSEAINKALGAPAGTMSESTAGLVKRMSEELVRYMLFTDEAPLTGPVSGTSRFAAEYAAQGPRDAKGRSLREFDLKRRLLKYPCSPLIYSTAFQSLPQPLRKQVNRRLWDVLSGQDKDAAFARLSEEDRTAMREILTDTKVLTRPE